MNEEKNWPLILLPLAKCSRIPGINYFGPKSILNKEIRLNSPCNETLFSTANKI
jgi:hypothetical protein